MPFEKPKPSDIFQCRRCGDCCRGFGGTYVTPAEVNAIAAFIKVDTQEFLAKYCQLSGQRPLLSQGREGYCIFWKGDCRIHPVKPRMCRRWPFLESVLIDIQNWQIMAGMCPGMRCDAPDSTVRKCVEEQLRRDHPPAA